MPDQRKTTDESTERKRVQVNLDADLARKIGIIASSLDMSVPDYVNNRLQPIVDDELPRMMDGMGFTKKTE